MIDDAELIEIFRTESQERLHSLDQGLLRLEANPRDAAALEEVFRDAHNLKGAARMIGVETVGTVAHRFEDLLGEARRGQLLLTSERIDGLYYGLDAIRRLVAEVVEGAAAGIDLATVLAVIDGELPVPRPAPEASVPQEEPDLGPSEPESAAVSLAQNGADLSLPAYAPVNGGSRPAESRPVNGAGHSDPAPRDPEGPAHRETGGKPAAGVEEAHGFRIETIRVEPQKLDVLMTHAGELTVTKSRIARRLAEMDELIGLQEEWSRELFRAGRFRPNGHKANAPAATATERERLERLGQLLADLKSAAAEDLARLEFVTDQLEQGIRSVRLLPFSTLFNLFPRMVRDLAREQGKEVQLVIEGGEITADKRILEEVKDPLMHMLRNAVDHGIESPAERVRAKKPPARLRIQARQTGSHIVIDVEDDGRGIDLEAVRRTALRRRVRTEEELAAMEPGEIRELIFAPGFSTRTIVTDVSGRGVGLDVVRKNVEQLKGTLEVESEPGRGCLIRLVLPITVATTRVLILSAAGQTFALPIEHVESARRVAPVDIFPIKGTDSTLIDGAPVTVAPLARLLNLAEAPPRGRETPAQFIPCILLRLGSDVLGVLVDDLLDEQEIVVKPLGALLKRVPNVAGATILGTGEVCVVLNAPDLLKTARQRTAGGAMARKPALAERRRVILLVEDSITTRAQEKRILEGAGYEVVTAVDGLDGFQKLGTRDFDAVISDVEMPNMDGLTLAERIRQAGPYRELPIVLVTSLASDESRRRGMEAGADAYLVKSMFDQAELLETIRRLL